MQPQGPSISTAPEPDLVAFLRKYWGYDEFRPRQEGIVRAILAGQDVAAVMPTGGGKSLCYQLPAVVMGRTAVVISPLIALMHDQVQQLGEMGIPAAALNSNMPFPEQREVIGQAAQGRLRLLYLSPERLLRDDTFAMLARVPVGFFAIDEAHCISEWGHEFRPEYRSLGKLRELFPSLPIAAFTASATRRVRHDILRQLCLREPQTFIRSFFRSNLRYWVEQCSEDVQEKRLLAAVRAYDDEVIVYAPTIARVQSTVGLLRRRGIAAVAYHGQMEAEERRRNQEMWMSGEAKVVVGTIAFGMGINKATVRAVIHLSLPKSLEQYYQEAGRAGRDGLPADCVLLHQKRDAGLLAHFINQLADDAERERAWARYREMKRFVGEEQCRHWQMCRYFGETPKWEKCDACDVCGFRPHWLVERALEEAPEAVLSVRRAASAAAHGDPELFNKLREWRREMAAEMGVPAFVVLHDSTIEELSRAKPSSIGELRQITGIGERKATTYGKRILEVIAPFRA